MNKLIVILGMFLLIGIVGCNRSTCPTYNNSTGQMELKQSKKTTSGVYPKGMRR